ncbi:MAG: suppressor of fused domain protein [Bacteroides sp.]|nr:suppressor of fused domain protein [Bacteroides sp.]
MTLEEYKKKVQEDDTWAPGWEMIDTCMERLYGDQQPEHYGTNLTARASMGGDQYLDGYSIYTSGKGYKHIVTYGMSDLYADPERYGQEYNGWGYEITMKLAAESARECMWAIDMMANLARYTFRSQKWFESYHYIAGDGTSVNRDVPSAITALLIVEDTELPEVDTVHGKLGFMQLVGITEPEMRVLRSDPSRVKELVEAMKQDNPQLSTDLKRTKSYLKETMIK